MRAEIEAAMRFLAAATALALASACSYGPVWEPRLEGRVVDAETGAPVVGALVEASYTVHAVGIESATRQSPQGWSYSDPDGRFVIAGRWKIRISDPFVSWSDTPTLLTYHPEYDWSFHREPLGATPGWSALELRLEHSREDRDVLDRATSPVDACRSTPSLCPEFCRVAFPGLASCADQAERRGR